jgi:hypothetical protein
MGALKSLKQLLNDQVVKCSTDSCKLGTASSRVSRIESWRRIAAAKGIRDEWKRATVREKMVASTVVTG